jgi:putative pyruvate formate lyase activating enzyme
LVELNRTNIQKPIESLNHYFAILKGIEYSFSYKSLNTPAKAQKTLKNMWIEHDKISRKTKNESTGELEKPVETSFSYLDLKIEIAEELFTSCIFCERRCEINRNKEIGYCGVKNSKIASEFLHMGEERVLVPSHTIFFTGCTFNCVYCQNMDISTNPREGIFIKPNVLANIIDEKRESGSLNVNFVGGDPCPNLLYILKTIRLLKENIPIVWNSNFYMSKEAMCLLDGVIDLYLTDFKYGSNECASRLSGIPDYWDVVTRNHKMAFEAGDMIIRHLVLPNHLKCCTFPVLDWIRKNLGINVVINIMAQYRPLYGAVNHYDISRHLYKEEYLKAIRYAQKLGFKNLI